MNAAYEVDFAAWAEEQATQLRSRAANALDWDNLAEEIESLSRSDHREVRSRLLVICQHLLKVAYQSNSRAVRGWRRTVLTQRHSLDDVLADSPSLRPYATMVLAAAYKKGRESAAEETRLAHLLVECPWTIAEVLDPGFWPAVPGCER